MTRPRVRAFSDDDIPPVIRLLLDANLLASGDAATLVRKMNRLLPELRRQARWSVENFRYFEPSDAPAGALVATTNGGINPFAVAGVCWDSGCKAWTALTMARTLGLYADIALVPDTLTRYLASWRRPADNYRFFTAHILVLRILEPMIRSGVIRFWPGSIPVCKPCASVLGSTIDHAALDLLHKTRKPPIATINRGLLSVAVEGPFADTIFYTKQATVTGRRTVKSARGAKAIGRAMFLEAVEHSSWSAMLDLYYSSFAHASLFSTHRQQLLALNALDSRAPSLNRVAAWENARSIQLPWVSDLSVEQVLALRQEAATALPAFREQFVRKIMIASTALPIASAVEDLRTEAATLEVELKAARSVLERTFRGVFGVLAMSFAVYSAATGQGVAGTAGLLSALGLLHASGRADHKEKLKAQSSPAYVLLKAKELSTHAH